MFFVHDYFFLSGTSLLWIMGESLGEGLWLLTLVTGRRWLVICDMWNVTFFLKGQKSHLKYQKCKWKAKKCSKVQKSVKKMGFHSIGELSAHASHTRDFFGSEVDESVSDLIISAYPEINWRKLHEYEARNTYNFYIHIHNNKINKKHTPHPKVVPNTAFERYIWQTKLGSQQNHI